MITIRQIKTATTVMPRRGFLRCGGRSSRFASLFPERPGPVFARQSHDLERPWRVDPALAGDVAHDQRQQPVRPLPSRTSNRAMRPRRAAIGLVPDRFAGP